MSLYAMGDLHLSFAKPKPMEIYDMVWKDHPDKIMENWHRCIREEDTVVITGDHSWGSNLAECEPDFRFIENLPGRKILLRGNHDVFWDAKKTEALNQQFEGRLSFLQNNFYTYGEYALVGTKGYCDEGKDSREHYEKVMNREMGRLRMSFQQAKDAGYEKFVMFLHYPPTSKGETESVFTRMAEEFGAEKVIYSHCHGQDRYYESLHGEKNGIRYQLVSADFLRFRPDRIL